MKNQIITKTFRLVRKTENIFAFTVIIFIALIPTLDSILHLFRVAILASPQYITHLVLLLAFMGGMIASRNNKHILIGAFIQNVKGPLKKWLNGISTLIACSICTALTWSSLHWLLTAFTYETVGIFPVQVFALFIPLGYVVMAFRFVLASELGRKGKLLASLGFILGSFLTYSAFVYILGSIFNDIPFLFYDLEEIWYSVVSFLAIPGIILLIIAAFLGTPIFVVLGGILILLIIQPGLEGDLVLTNIADEAYKMLKDYGQFPAIVLFTFIGVILAEGKAGQRLIRFFRSLVGWIPGGIAIMAVLVCAFFTTFTGASGITILALGGILFLILTQSGNYGEEYGIGLLTAAGSIGLLFPPSVIIILYATFATTKENIIPIPDLFIGALIPGILMVLAMSFTGVFIAIKRKVKPTAFTLKEVFISTKEAAFEILLPFIIIFLYFTGILGLIGTSALGLIYILIIEVFVRRDIKIIDLPRVALRGATIIGGIFLILTTAKAFSFFIGVDANIPQILSDWMLTHIQSPFVFLLLLNVALLITGCFMDIFSALILIVPLIAQLGIAYGIHPVHLGVVFIVNMEIGYLTPPIGLNLFLASYCFEKPVAKIYKNVFPFFLIQLVILLLITYVPPLTTLLLDFF